MTLSEKGSPCPDTSQGCPRRSSTAWSDTHQEELRVPSHLSAEPFRQRGGHCSGLRDTEDVREVLFPDGTRFIRGCLGEEPKWGKRRDPGDLGSNMGKQGKKKKKE